MIYLFYAPSGGGKSSSATAMMTQFLTNEVKVNKDSKGLFSFLDIPPAERLEMCHDQIDYLNEVYDLNLEKPVHVVQSNLTMYTENFGEYIQSYNLPGDKIGLYDEMYETYCPAPCSIIVWDETQKEASGRDSQNMDARVSAELQLHRKWKLDILCLTQRSKILDLNIRDNCVIVEVESFHHKYDKFGAIKETTFKYKVFTKLADLERYLSTGKKTYQKTSFTFKGCVYDHFDTNEGEEYFIDLAKKRGINLRIKDLSLTPEDWVKENPYTPPLGYQKIKKAERVKFQKEKEKKSK